MAEGSARICGGDRLYFESMNVAMPCVDGFIRKKSWLARTTLTLAICTLALSGLQRVSAAPVVMNYGADGNDYFQFTTPSMAFDKASGFTTLITFGIHVNPDGTLLIGGAACASNGIYVRPVNWGSLIV